MYLNDVNKLYLSYQKYKTNGNVRDEKYKGKLLFPMKGFVLFVTDHQSIYFMSTRLLKDNIGRFRVPQISTFLNIQHSSSFT